MSTRDITLPGAGYPVWTYRVGKTVEGIAVGGTHRFRLSGENVTRELTARHRAEGLTTEQAPVAVAEDTEDGA